MVVVYLFLDKPKMVRQRRNLESKKSSNSSSSNGSTPPKTKEKTSFLIYWKPFVGFVCFAVAVIIGYMGYLETRVNTPYDDKKVGPCNNIIVVFICPMLYF